MSPTQSLIAEPQIFISKGCKARNEGRCLKVPTAGRTLRENCSTMPLRNPGDGEGRAQSLMAPQPALGFVAYRRLEWPESLSQIRPTAAA
jgi:hypothetical protein